MSRKGQAPEREVLPDPRYDSKLVAKFINVMMWGGKKSASERILYDALKIVQDKKQKDPLETFNQAVENVKPSVEVRSRRVGGATYQVPVEVRPRRRQALAIRWLIQYARERSEKTMQERLAAEILEAAENQGNAIKKKQDTHRMADANKAFAHYRW